MKKKHDSPLRMILFILILANIIILRDGFLVNSKLYFALFGAVPLAFYAAHVIWKGRRSSNFSEI